MRKHLSIHTIVAIACAITTCALYLPTASGAVSYPSGVVWDQADTSNYSTGRVGNRLDLVVIHTTEGSYQSAINWFNNPAANVSAHYVIDKDGSVTQMVSSWNTAWTQTYVNKRALSFEMAGYSNDPNTWVYCQHESQYVAGAKNYRPNLYKLANIVAYFIEKTSGNGITYDIPNAHPTDVGYYYSSNGPRLASTVRGIIGHNQVQADQKSDPGQYFPWDDFMGMVTGYLNGTLSSTPSVPEPSALVLLGLGSLGLLSRRKK